MKTLLITIFYVLLTFCSQAQNRYYEQFKENTTSFELQTEYSYTLYPKAIGWIKQYGYIEYNTLNPTMIAYYMEPYRKSHVFRIDTTTFFHFTENMEGRILDIYQFTIYRYSSVTNERSFESTIRLWFEKGNNVPVAYELIQQQDDFTLMKIYSSTIFKVSR